VEHENGFVASIIHLVLVLGLIWNSFGAYQLELWVIFIVCSSQGFATAWLPALDAHPPKLIRVYQFAILNSESIITKAQVALNIFLALFQENTEESHPTHSSPGAVPRAKAIMIKAQSIKFPVVMA
jgi:hypothetical protein